MDCKRNKRNIFQRLFGKCITGKPGDSSSWQLKDGDLIIDLSKTPELEKEYSGLRFENDDIRVLVVKFEDNELIAYENKCLHAQRRLDPVPGTDTIQCCSMGATTYDKEGNVLCGNVEGKVKRYEISTDDKILTVHLN